MIGARWGRVLVVLAALWVLSSCGSGGAAQKQASPLRSAPEPAVSPAPAADLPGTVVSLAGEPEGVAVTDAGTVAVNVRSADRNNGGLVIFPISSPSAATAATEVNLGGSARHLTLAGPDGPALVADESNDEFLRVALPGGQVLTSVRVGRQPHEAIAVNDTTSFVFDELANTIHVVRNDQVVRVVAAPLQPGGGAVAADGQHVVAVGVRGRRITEYTASGDIIGSTNCGAGPTHVVTGDGGLFWVNDTNGNAVLGFTVTTHGPKQVATIATGAGSKPYGIAYDKARHTLWTTLTGSDQLLGLTFDGTTVTDRATYATVQQPNTVAVDQVTGELVVTGSTPGTSGHLQFLR
jgi:hypothetical protein